MVIIPRQNLVIFSKLCNYLILTIIARIMSHKYYCVKQISKALHLNKLGASKDAEPRSNPSTIVVPEILLELASDVRNKRIAVLSVRHVRRLSIPN